MTAPIRNLARACARHNLRLRDAQAIFDAMYMADALARTDGRVADAANIAEISAPHWYRSAAPRSNSKGPRG